MPCAFVFLPCQLLCPAWPFYWSATANVAHAALFWLSQLSRRQAISCMQALAQATGKSMQKVKAEYDKEGDLGTVAANARSSQKTMFQSAPLTVRAVFK